MTFAKKGDIIHRCDCRKVRKNGSCFVAEDSFLPIIYAAYKKIGEHRAAAVAKLADAPDLGSGVFDVGVQVPSAAPNSRNPNLVPIGEGFGFLLYLDYPNFNSKLE